MSAFLNALKFWGGLAGFEKALKSMGFEAVNRLYPVGYTHAVDTVPVSFLGIKFDLTLTATRKA